MESTLENVHQQYTWFWQTQDLKVDELTDYWKTLKWALLW